MKSRIIKNEQYYTNNRMTQITSKLLLYTGIVIMIISLLYMIVNLHKSDSIVILWAVSMFCGVSFVWISIFINWANSIKSKK